MMERLIDSAHDNGFLWDRTIEEGEVGQRYVLGGHDMNLADILGVIAGLVGRRPPKVKLRHELILPLAYGAEARARLRGRGEPFATIDGVRMAKKKMFFSSAKAERRLGYRARPAQEALRDAVDWFREEGYLGQQKAAAKA